MKRIVLAVYVIALLVPCARGTAAPIDSAILAVESELRIDGAELEAVRQQITDERIPLRTELQLLTDSVRRLRVELAAASGDEHADRREAERLRQEVRQQKDDLLFLGELVMEYRRSIETRVPAGEAERLRDTLATLDRELGFDPARSALLPQFASRVVTLAVTAQHERIGGFRHAGVVILPDGTEHPAQLVASGPLCYAALDANGPAGLAISRSGHLAPLLHTELPSGAEVAIRALVAGAAADVPVDVTTRGDAIRGTGRRRRPVDELRSGGVVMIPLIAVGVVAALVALWKVLEMSRVCVRDDAIVTLAITELDRGDETAALHAADAAGAPLGALLRDAIAYRDAPREHLEEILHEHIVAGIPRLERHLALLAVLGGIAPLLGLLGTVTGMMHTFQLVTVFGTGEARLLSSGISEALITTKFGLSIAIPILLVHAVLARHVRTRIGLLEASAVMFVNRLKQNGGQHA